MDKIPIEVLLVLWGILAGKLMYEIYQLTGGVCG